MNVIDINISSHLDAVTKYLYEKGKNYYTHYRFIGTNRNAENILFTYRLVDEKAETIGNVADNLYASFETNEIEELNFTETINQDPIIEPTINETVETDIVSNNSDICVVDEIRVVTDSCSEDINNDCCIAEELNYLRTEYANLQSEYDILREQYNTLCEKCRHIKKAEIDVDSYFTMN